MSMTIQDCASKKIKRDNDGIAHIVALSGGKDSTALALALAEHEPRPYTYVCTPTGNELPAMFEHWRILERLLGESIISLTSMSLRDLIEKEKTIPNYRMRFCTRKLKLIPFYDFIVSAKPVVSYIGLRADEEARNGLDTTRSAKTRGGDVIFKEVEGIHFRKPLQEWGWNVNDVWDFLEEKEVSIPERTDCAWCFFQKQGEWYVLWRDHRDKFVEAEELEKRIGYTFRTPGGDKWPTSLEGMRRRFERGMVPAMSLRMMDKRKNMCRMCSL